jgi:hypothetical protein
MPFPDPVLGEADAQREAKELLDGLTFDELHLLTIEALVNARRPNRAQLEYSMNGDIGRALVPLLAERKAMRRTFQDLARRAAVDGLVQRSICGHLTEEMTERYSSVAQVEVEAALGKVVSLAGYRDLLSGASTEARSRGNSASGGKVVGNAVGAIEGSGARKLQPTAVA